MCETYTERDRKLAEILAKKVADAAAEVKKRQDLVDAGYTIVTQELRRHSRRDVFINPVILRSRGKIVYRIELVSSEEWSGRLTLSLPEDLDERVVILSHNERKSLLEFAYKELELISERQLRDELEEKEKTRIVDAYYNQKPTATVSGKDSPFAALAALKLGK